MRKTKEVKQYYYSQIDKLRERYSVEWLCQLFEVSRSGYYKWKRRGNEENCYIRTQKTLDRYIEQLHGAHPSSGYRALNSRLRAETGWVVCDASVLRSMQRLSIKARVRKNRKSPAAGEEHKKFPNLLNREFHADRPLSKVATDITQIKYKGQAYSFVCYLDLFNNEILEWNVRQDESMELLLPPLKRLLKRKRMITEPQMLLHSDQWTQYSSAGYYTLIKKYNVIQSMSRIATPRDNAVIESVFGWFKEFLAADFFPNASEPIERLLAKAVYEFNYYRPSCKLNYKSPVQFRIEQGFH